MFSLFSLLVFLAVAINALAFPHNPWPLRRSQESAPLQIRDESLPVDKRNDPRKLPNFSLPLQPRNDARNDARNTNSPSPSPLSPRNFSFPLRARDGNESLSSSTIPEGAIQPYAPGIDALVLDPNGTDITSNFQIMVFRDVENLNDKAKAKKSKKGKRQFPPSSSRSINTCQSKTAIFRSSSCLAGQGLVTGSRISIQHYIVWCRERSGKSPEQVNYRANAHSEFGACKTNEVCVDGHVSHDVGAASMARCVLKRYYQPMDVPHRPKVQASSGQGEAESSAQGAGKGEGQGEAASSSQQGAGEGEGQAGAGAGASSTQAEAGSVAGSFSSTSSGQQQVTVDLGGLTASTVVSMEDGVTPLEVDTLEVDAGEAATVSADGTVQSSTCRDCHELSTNAFPQDTNFIKAKAKLIATAVVAGVIWLALS